MALPKQLTPEEQMNAIMNKPKIEPVTKPIAEAIQKTTTPQLNYQQPKEQLQTQLATLNQVKNAIDQGKPLA